jgi:hypothetical protein
MNSLEIKREKKRESENVYATMMLSIIFNGERNP